MKNIFLVIGFIFTLSHLFGQKNNLYVNAGSLGLLHSLNLNYELKLSKETMRNRYYLRVSSGVLQGTYYNSDDDIDPIYNIGLMGVGLFGKGSSFFETNIGITRLIHTGEEGINEDRINTLPMIGLGYRYENLKWLFRVGAHFPEGIYLGAGLRF